MELIISVLSLFIRKGGEGGEDFGGSQLFSGETGGGGISLRQQSIKGRLEKIDCQLTSNVRVGDQ